MKKLAGSKRSLYLCKEKIQKIMARPIAETPVLTGEDAARFDRLRLEVENLSSEQREENTRKLKDTVKEASKIIRVCL